MGNQVLIMLWRRFLATASLVVEKSSNFLSFQLLEKVLSLCSFFFLNFTTNFVLFRFCLSIFKKSFLNFFSTYFFFKFLFNIKKKSFTIWHQGAVNTKTNISVGFRSGSPRTNTHFWDHTRKMVASDLVNLELVGGHSSETHSNWAIRVGAIRHCSQLLPKNINSAPMGEVN